MTKNPRQIIQEADKTSDRGEIFVSVDAAYEAIRAAKAERSQKSEADNQ